MNELVNNVFETYSEAALSMQPLCCPIQYDPELLKIIPQEIIDRDYGCGDPSPYVKTGDIVLDLGSGGGKLCYISSQLVGPEGKVIGVDINDDMLALAIQYKQEIAESIGYDNVIFKKGKIEDLRLDREAVSDYLKENPCFNDADFKGLEDFITDQKKNRPLIDDNSIDVIVSNCVLNLVSEGLKKDLINEIYRVLKRGGRIALSDIVADEPVPEILKNDPDLWSGCISGAFVEDELIAELENAGFYGINIVKRDDLPWRVINGIEFRSITVTANKGKDGECLDYQESLMYKGPFKSVTDDDGHEFLRGQHVAVCRKTFEIFKRDIYKDYFYFIHPKNEVTDDEATIFDCSGNSKVRKAAELKGSISQSTCDSATNCC